MGTVITVLRLFHWYLHFVTWTEWRVSEPSRHPLAFITTWGPLLNNSPSGSQKETAKYGEMVVTLEDTHPQAPKRVSVQLQRNHMVGESREPAFRKGRTFKTYPLRSSPGRAWRMETTRGTRGANALWSSSCWTCTVTWASRSLSPWYSTFTWLFHPPISESFSIT